jgi:hypothetical protein
MRMTGCGDTRERHGRAGRKKGPSSDVHGREG